MFTNREKMKKFESPTLEEAYELAKEHFNCKISQLDCEIVQYPSKGFLGIGKKSAIIIASCTSCKQDIKEQSIAALKPKQKEIVKNDVVDIVKEVPEPIFEIKNEVIKEKNIEVSKYNEIDSKMYNGEQNSKVYYRDKECDSSHIVPVQNIELAKTIEDEIKRLFSLSCYHVDVVEVDIIDNNALIFIDGDDVALLIGKDGYRYNAISYMLFNWLYAKYELFVKLEIASFVTSQEEMIASMLLPVIDKINSDGKGRTRPFKGILIQIALMQLRIAFPSKYVAIKKNKNGDRYIIVNDFNSKPNE